MRFMRCVLAVAATALTAGSPLVAQMPGQGLPGLKGVWSPRVGSGAVYQLDDRREGKQEMEIAVVGTESVDGRTGHWLEVTMKRAEEGQIVIKSLIVLSGEQTEAVRWIMQMGDQPPMEFSMRMQMPGPKAADADIRKQAEHLGTETVTTPAGTFSCEHYRSKDGGDVWISEKVPPYGLVKMISRDSSLTLVRVLSDAKSKIKGTPQKFDPGQMMRRP